MGISNISITNITDVEALELNPGGGGGPTPPEEEMYPMPTSSVELTDDIGRTTLALSDTSRLSLQNDDLLIAAIGIEAYNATITPTQAGWTELYRKSELGGTLTAALFWRIVNTGSDPTAYDWSGWAASDVTMRILGIRGADPSAPFPDSYAYAQVHGAGTTALLSPDITTSLDGMALLRLIEGQRRQIATKTHLYGGSLSAGYSGSLAKCIVLSRSSSQSTGTGAVIQEAALQFLPSAGAAGVWNLDTQATQQFMGFTIPIAPAP